jgi:hypothetical protein
LQTFAGQPAAATATAAAATVTTASTFGTRSFFMLGEQRNRSMRARRFERILRCRVKREALGGATLSSIEHPLLVTRMRRELVDEVANHFATDRAVLDVDTELRDAHPEMPVLGKQGLRIASSVRGEVRESVLLLCLEMLVQGRLELPPSEPHLSPLAHVEDGEHLLRNIFELLMIRTEPIANLRFHVRASLLAILAPAPVLALHRAIRRFDARGFGATTQTVRVRYRSRAEEARAISADG